MAEPNILTSNLLHESQLRGARLLKVGGVFTMHRSAEGKTPPGRERRGPGLAQQSYVGPKVFRLEQELRGPKPSGAVAVEENADELQR